MEQIKRKSVKWTKEEEDFLIENYTENGIAYCIKYLNRSRNSIKNKVKILKIKYISSINRINKLKDDIIKDYNDKIKLKDIATKYNTCVRTINKIIRSNNVVRTGSKNKHVGSEHGGWKGYGEISSKYMKSIEYGAKRRGLNFDIDIFYTWELFISQHRRCALSGIELKFKKFDKDYKTQTASLDRIDSSFGYIEGNVQWVHKRINFMKQSLSDNEFIELCKLVTDHQRNKN